MPAMLKVVDRIPGQGHRAGPELTLASERITAAELIRRRVESEVEAFNASSDEVFQGLVEPTEAEHALNGYRMKKGRKLDVKTQVKVALGAFTNNGFVLLFDDRQIEDPDEVLTITPVSEAVFVKIVPLVGG